MPYGVSMTKIPTDTQWQDLANRIRNKNPLVKSLATVSDVTGNITSDKGNTYSYTTVNGGTGLKITSGASNIRRVVTSTTWRNSSLTSSVSLGLHGVKSNNEAIARFLCGLWNNTAMTAVQKTVTPTTEYTNFSYNTTNVSYTHGAIRVEWLREEGSDKWCGFFNICLGDNSTAFSGVVICIAKDVNTVPTIYRPGANANNVTNANQMIEIYEN